jgi:Zn-dependent peptidase ImmA (M78 family)
MGEFQTILKARQFVRSAGIASVPVDIECLAAVANAKIKIVNDLADDESGQTTQIKGKHIIIVNGKHQEERQRFTVLHEIAHIVLDLPSQHHGANITTRELLSYRRRPKEEILCDVFAAECLLPYSHFKRDVDDVEVSLDVVKDLAKRYKASITSTCSRFAFNCTVPCAYVLMERGRVRYVSMSKHLRELAAWIDLGIHIPSGSVAHRISHTNAEVQDYDEIAANIWFNNGVKGFDLVAEEAMVRQEWDQCLSLIWLDERMRHIEPSNGERAEDEEPLLEELNGVLPWPSKKRR